MERYVLEEQKTLLTKYNIDESNLENLPMEAYDEMKNLDLVLNEVLRLTISGVTMRRQMKDDISLCQGKYKLPVGSFAIYLIGNTHLEPKVWNDPERFDPSRFVDRDCSSNAQFPFLGFGVGQHPCLGMKLARLEIKMITFVLLQLFDWKLQSADGRLPKPNRNNLHTTRPEGKDIVMLSCRRKNKIK